ncbi:hypothetical protein Q5Y75_07980 [Ruegeria sp. 2205SS24-7]|uniref:hypothetical protein n=1 Tax=Ruegeria discodermiae TaxID=3064389 RepID=UPI0027408611|nr:hypothetical protein [Ruegeria sp. 2205SS24-7]MDP5217152.1 hypothetical protein [Ruegeria sp. 2205SS24-7]
MLSDQVIVGPKLERCFRKSDPEAMFLLAVFYVSGGLTLLAVLKLAHHAMELPSLPYLWELLMSLCS